MSSLGLAQLNCYILISEVRESQVLDYYGCSHGIYSINFPLFVLGYFNPSENVDAMTKILIYNICANIHGDRIWSHFFVVAEPSGKKKAISETI